MKVHNDPKFLINESLVQDTFGKGALYSIAGGSLLRSTQTIFWRIRSIIEVPNSCCWLCAKFSYSDDLFLLLFETPESFQRSLHI